VAKCLAGEQLDTRFLGIVFEGQYRDLASIGSVAAILDEPIAAPTGTSEEQK
jgi:hypothetical protein